MCPHREHPAKTSRKLPVDPGDNLLVESSSESLKNNDNKRHQTDFWKARLEFILTPKRYQNLKHATNSHHFFASTED